jgi:hypothetical protein
MTLYPTRTKILAFDSAYTDLYISPVVLYLHLFIQYSLFILCSKRSIHQKIEMDIYTFNFLKNTSKAGFPLQAYRTETYQKRF